jgi:putative Mg2+ transporter-C (MgtC) family protein
VSLDAEKGGLMLVAGSAALLVGLGEVLLERFSAGGESLLIRADPIRIVEAIITGISFLGAGTIFAAAATRSKA